MFAFHDSVGRVEVAFTSARTGARAFNLALPGTVPARLGDPVADAALLAAAFGDPQLRGMSQVHGDVIVDARPAGEAERSAPEADGIVTHEPGVALLVRTADCVPVLVADVDAGVVGAAHAGRNGVALDVVGALLGRMRRRGALHLRAWIGPHVCGGCYEVPASMRQEVARVVPSAWASTTWQTPSLDLGAGVRSQLAAGGVDDVVDVGLCTVEDPSLWSHRRQGAQAGRLAGIVQVRP